MTSALSRLEERIEALEAAAEAIKEETRLAHEATKRLREAHKEVRDILKTESKALVEEAIAEEVKKGLERYSDTIGEQIEIATHKVYQRFDEVVNTLITGKASGDGTIFGIQGTRLKK